MVMACFLGLLSCAGAVAATDSAEKKATATASSCDYNSFGRVANGQSFWSATGQFTVPNLNLQQMNCLLDQFAMNNFLYLVGTGTDGKPRFMGYAPWYALFTTSGAPSWPGAYSPLNATELHRFKNETQAGDGYVLKDINAQTTSYDIRVNKTFFDYVNANSLYKQSAFNAAVQAFKTNSATGGIWFPPTSSKDTGEGAVELKTSWRNYGPMQKKFISQKISMDINPCPNDLMHCEQDASGNFWGLVGFHLVAKTLDQPGFVWASFEHVGNAPDCAAGSSMPIGQNPISPATGKPMNLNGRLLNKIGAKSGWNYFNYATYKQAGGDGKVCTYPTSQQANTQCLGLPQDKNQAWIPVNICRTLALPVPTSAHCAGSIADGSNLKAASCLNQSVMRNFAGTKLAAKWQNYRLVGMEWLSSGATGFGAPAPACLTYDETGPATTACPNYQPATHGLGDGGGPPNFGRSGSSGANTPSPANTTMETWMQYKVNLNNNASQTDCFLCHQPATAGGTGGFGQGDFSHIFGRISQP
jgi:hypothetical protein